MSAERTVLVHLASGIGNVVLATPMLCAMCESGYTIDLLIDGDYAEIADLFMGWSALRAVFNGSRGECPTDRYAAVVPAVPPFYWSRYSSRYARRREAVRRPPDALFYENEQAYYLAFARSLGCAINSGTGCFLPIAPDRTHGVELGTLVLAPGCKTGEMAAKRWPYYPRLAEAFGDVVIVGTADDLYQADGRPMRFPGHVRSMVGLLSLRETAEVIAGAGVVVANDSGLGHLSGAVGTTTVLLFGPTPERVLGALPPNVQVLRVGLSCQPCWFTAKLRACAGAVPCLRTLSPDVVIGEVRRLLPVFSTMATVAETGSNTLAASGCIAP